MKITAVIVRILMGLLFLSSSIVVLFKLVPQPQAQGDVKLFNMGLAASVFLVPLIKMIELICSIAFLSGRFVPLATVVIFPVTVNILFFHAFLAPEGLPIALLLVLGNLFLAYTYRQHYQTLMIAK